PGPPRCRSRWTAPPRRCGRSAIARRPRRHERARTNHRERPPDRSLPMLTGTCHCGAARWSFDGDPGSATACNCTLCRKYGVLWIVDGIVARIADSGPLTSEGRSEGGALEFNFCPGCGNLVQWKGRRPGADGRVRTAVNLRLADNPEAAMHLPIDHFDGLDSF